MGNLSHWGDSALKSLAEGGEVKRLHSNAVSQVFFYFMLISISVLTCTQ